MVRKNTTLIKTTFRRAQAEAVNYFIENMTKSRGLMMSHLAHAHRTDGSKDWSVKL